MEGQLALLYLLPLVAAILAVYFIVKALERRVAELERSLEKLREVASRARQASEYAVRRAEDARRMAREAEQRLESLARRRAEETQLPSGSSGGGDETQEDRGEDYGIVLGPATMEDEAEGVLLRGGGPLTGREARALAERYYRAKRMSRMLADKKEEEGSPGS